ncbi:MAG: hypothetical protein Q4F41_03795 [Eubacteriales bacterium]|nr:hypothetical protein [Eubacteriales bacterium]
MRRGYAIGIFLCMLFIGALYTMSFHLTENGVEPLAIETEKTPETEPETEEISPAKEAVSSGSSQAGMYYLKEQDGMVLVYRGDKRTLYERTAIRVETLPEILQLEVRMGKMLKTEQELYSFLENYSS